MSTTNEAKVDMNAQQAEMPIPSISYKEVLGERIKDLIDG